MQWNILNTFPAFTFSRLLCSKTTVAPISHSNTCINFLYGAFAFASSHSSGHGWPQ